MTPATQALEELSQYAGTRPLQDQSDLVTGTLRVVATWLVRRTADITSMQAENERSASCDVQDLAEQLALLQDAAHEAASHPPIVVEGEEGEPLLRISHFREAGDASVGIQPWEGWILDQDQSGTGLGVLEREGSSAALINALEAASLRARTQTAEPTGVPASSHGARR